MSYKSPEDAHVQGRARALYDINPNFRGIYLTDLIFEEVFTNKNLLIFKDCKSRFFEMSSQISFVIFSTSLSGLVTTVYIAENRRF